MTGSESVCGQTLAVGQEVVIEECSIWPGRRGRVVKLGEGRVHPGELAILVNPSPGDTCSPGGQWYQPTALRQIAA